MSSVKTQWAMDTHHKKREFNSLATFIAVCNYFHGIIVFLFVVDCTSHLMGPHISTEAQKEQTTLNSTGVELIFLQLILYLF